MAHTYIDNDFNFISPPRFNKDKFVYLKNRIKSFFLGQDADLWDMTLNSNTHPLDANGVRLERSKMNE